MEPFPVDRTHSPSRLVYRDADRFLELRPWALADADAPIAAWNTSHARALLREHGAAEPLVEAVGFAIAARCNDVVERFMDDLRAEAG